MEIQFLNHFVLSGEFLTAERNVSARGIPYYAGQVQLIGLDVVVPYRAAGTGQERLQANQAFVLSGSFQYEKKQVLLIIEEWQIPILEKPENRCTLTVRAGQDGELRYSKKGTAWSTLPAALSMGKDKDGHYRPSWWLEVKGFGRGQDESIPLSLASLNKGDIFSVFGRLDHQVYQEHVKWSLVLIEAIHLPEAIPSVSHAEVVPD